MALRGFRAVAADHNARLGLLRIGTFGGEEYETGMCWRKDFYSKYGWVAFNTPPVPGLILVWMYHPFPSLSDEERLMRGRLSKATPDKNELALVEGQG